MKSNIAIAAALAAAMVSLVSSPAEARQVDETPVTTPVQPPSPPPVVEEKKPESLAFEAPKTEVADTNKLEIAPYLIATGGLKYDWERNPPGTNHENRVSTFALSRFGLSAHWGKLISAESEIMAAGGIGLHGTSAYEGQAALQVRQQVIRFGYQNLRLEVGRLIDEASVDFFSAHVAESFLQDTATRDPLLFTGFNLGNGVRAQYEFVPGLRAALTFNAGNPVATTSSLLIGGSFPPFERFYTQPYQAVNQGPNHFPDDTFHIMVLTPSVLVDTKYVDARAALQMFDVDPNTGDRNNDHLRGYNARATVRVKLLDGMLTPFANVAYTRNDTVLANDLATRSPDRYQSIDYGGGIDFNWARRFQCAHDCADGIGLQYENIQFQTGEGLVTTQRYANLGATVWLAPNLSVGARLALWSYEPENAAATGQRSGLLAMRFIMK